MVTNKTSIHIQSINLLSLVLTHLRTGSPAKTLDDVDVLLEFFRAYPSSLMLKTIRLNLNISPITLSTIITRFEKHRLIERRVSDDKRRKEYRLTARGFRIVNESIRQFAFGAEIEKHN